MGTYTLSVYGQDVFTIRGVDGFLKSFGQLQNGTAVYFPRRITGEAETDDSFRVPYDTLDNQLRFPDTTPLLPRSGNLDEESGLGRCRPRQERDRYESDREIMAEAIDHYMDEGIDLTDYSALKEKNADFAGWLTVPDTKINYPVLYRPQDQDYYLHRDFEGQEAAAGCLYIQENCDAEKPTDNVIIYGHNMKNGSMFGELEKYEDPSFWDTHRTFTFNTLNRFQTFEVVTVFKTVAYQEDAFRYYQFVEAEGEADFDAFLSQCQARALYDTGVEARFGDRLLTLSTCEYSRENGRLAVLARRIDP